MKHTNHVIASKKLGKDVNVRVYGTKGYPVIAFPTQDQMADEWEDNGMLDVFEPYLTAGRVQLFTVDSNDLESWSSTSDDFAARIARQEDYYDFVCDELVPFVHETNGSLYRPELMGCSLGATQATIDALRRPDLFQGVIGLSGMYHTSYFFGDWGNDTSYANDVNAFLPNTPADHPYLPLYRQRTFAFSIGQAADEQFGVSDLHFLQDTFQRLGINGWFDFWGPECNHDWYWWKQQMAKFLPEAVKELEGVAAAEPELAKLPVKAKKAEPKKSEPDKAEKAAKASKPAAEKKATAAKAPVHKTAKATEPKAAKAEPAAKATKAAKTTAKATPTKKAEPAAKAAKATTETKKAAKPAATKPAAKSTTAKQSAAKPAPVQQKAEPAASAPTTAKTTKAATAKATTSTAAKTAPEAKVSSAKRTSSKKTATRRTSATAKKSAK